MEKLNNPEIRFKEYLHSWYTVRLGDITDCYSGGTPTVGVKHFYGGNIPFIRSGEISDSKTELFLTNEGVENSSAKLVKKNDVLYALYGATSGEVSLSKINGAINQAILAIIPSHSIKPEFIVYWLRKAKSKIISNYLQGGQGNLSAEIVKDLLVSLPNSDDTNEQTQIGQFFQNLDQSIALHEQKLTQTQNLKQAMLEKMFPKAGNKQPEIRLKGFSGDWAISQLSDFISIKHGFAFDGRYFSEMESNLCLITPGNFLIGGGFKTEKFVYYKGTVPNNYILSDDDIIVTMTDLSKDSDTLGCPALIPKKDGKIFLHNQRIGLISFEENGLNKGFLFYLLQTNFYHKYIVLSATGTTVKHTSPDKIKSFSCHIPEYEEQVKIGQFFEKIDGVMALHKQQLQTLKNLKQAFLIKMFV